MALIHPHIAVRLNKGQSYTSTSCLGLHGLFYGELQLLPIHRMKVGLYPKRVILYIYATRVYT
jgi:hypothetical protein